MAQPLTGHTTRQQSAIQGARVAAEPAQVTQPAPNKPARSRKAKRPAADLQSQNDDDAEFLKDKTDAEKRALMKRLLDDLNETYKTRE